MTIIAIFTVPSSSLYSKAFHLYTENNDDYRRFLINV